MFQLLFQIMLIKSSRFLFIYLFSGNSAFCVSLYQKRFTCTTRVFVCHVVLATNDLVYVSMCVTDRESGRERG